MGIEDDLEITRRLILSGSGGAALLAAAPPGVAAVAGSGAGASAPGIAPTIFPYLAPLQDAVDQLANTWAPDDPWCRADFYRQIMMNLSWSYFCYFHANAEHPDWGPQLNPVYLDQPNPDDIYVVAPLRGDLTYRISGNRGTCALLTFNTQKGLMGMVENLSDITQGHDFDAKDLNLEPNGEFELILSVTRPAGYEGDWQPITPETDALLVRYVMIDWVKERDPQLSIECLDPVPPKRRLTPDEITHRIEEMARLPGRIARGMLGIQNSIRKRGGINEFVVDQYPGGLSRQVYWPAVFEFDDGEALIIETDLPKVRPYWNIQLNDPYYNAIEYVYRASSLNEASAHIGTDGRLRAVLALEDPGVPNWLDTAGYKTGTVYGRWYECDTQPHPVIKRVQLADIRAHLPADTPLVSPGQRAEALRARVRAAQRRRRW